jgi:putative nucleotidyltransferase-like protein
LERNPPDADAFAAAMRAGRVDWQATVDLAERHLLLPALWPALLEKNLATELPPALRQFMAGRGTRGPGGEERQSVFLVLESAYAANLARNCAIRAELLAILSALNGAGVEPALLKGSRLLLSDAKADAAWRVLRDIDLLLRPEDWRAGLAALGTLGYRATAGDAGLPRQGVALIRNEGPTEIDLHVTPLSLHEPLSLPAWLTAEGFWQRAESTALEGCRYRRLPVAESLVHGVLHTEVADLNHEAGDWVLRYLYETAKATREAGETLDWSVVRGVSDQALARPLRAHLLAAGRLFGALLPMDFSAEPPELRQFQRCRRNLLHPESFRRAGFLVHKLRQAMTPWYLQRKGYYPESDGTRAQLWRARLWLLLDLLRWQLPRLLRRPFGGADDPVPPPRV